MPPSEEKQLPRKQGLSSSPYGKGSTLIILCVIFIFFLQWHQKSITEPPKIPGIVQAPLLKGVSKALVFDYPAYFEKRDALLSAGANQETIEEQLAEMSFWGGIYERFIHYIKKGLPISYQGPLFEKIKQGEYWRIFTPCLLHFDLLHIFFNLLWFIMLSNQIEFRIGSFRTLILIGATSIVSNISQYLMSGSFFMGLSGVVVGLAAFIWARQQVAPWEGYLLHRLTLMFLGIFVLGIFLLQVVLFFLQIFTSFELNIAIANTAHLVGGAVGYLLGRWPYFALRSSGSNQI